MRAEFDDRVATSRLPRRLSYIPAIDGLRGVAVLAVIAYHADVTWLHGGFLGVEIFFVVSGYLITALLLAEFDATGTIGFGAFWVRRARRLLPALGLFLIGTTALVTAFAPDAVTRLLLEIPMALGYVYNWFAIATEQSYFEGLARPSFLQHLWSLAIEEQFYLIWPIVVLFGTKIMGRKGMLLFIVAGIAGSSLLMSSSFVAFTDPSRLYYGTDTRAAGILVGAALASVWDPHRARRAPARWMGTLGVDSVGAVGLAVLAICLITLRDDVIGAPLLYRGGFLIVSTATALTIAAAVVPGGGVATILGSRLLRDLGLRSYAIYLWHWPVFLLMRPRLDVGLEGVELLTVRLGLTLVLAEISYRLVERPVRERRFLATVERLIVDAPRNLRTLAGVAAAAGGVVLVTGVLVGFQGNWRMTVAAAEALTPAATEAQESPGGEPSTSEASPSPAGVAEDQITESAAPVQPLDGAAGGDAADPDGQAGKALAPDTASSIWFNGLGDSVMLGAAGALEAIGLETLDAEVGRQWWDASNAAASMRRRGHVGDVFVLHLGHNGTLTPEMFDAVMQELGEARRIVVVNVSVPRRWEGSVNAELRAGVSRWPGAVLLDWHGIAEGRPGVFVSDGVHLSAAGRRLYVESIAAAVAGKTDVP